MASAILKVSGESSVVPVQPAWILQACDDPEIELLAFEIWQRCSCLSAEPEDLWITAEENIIAPH